MKRCFLFLQTKKATRTAPSREQGPGYRIDMLWVGAPRAGSPVLASVRSRIGLLPVSLQRTGQDRTGQGETKTVPVGGTSCWSLYRFARQSIEQRCDYRRYIC